MALHRTIGSVFNCVHMSIMKLSDCCQTMMLLSMNEHMWLMAVWHLCALQILHAQSRPLADNNPEFNGATLAEDVLGVVVREVVGISEDCSQGSLNPLAMTAHTRNYQTDDGCLSARYAINLDTLPNGAQTRGACNSSLNSKRTLETTTSRPTIPTSNLCNNRSSTTKTHHNSHHNKARHIRYHSGGWTNNNDTKRSLHKGELSNTHSKILFEVLNRITTWLEIAMVRGSVTLAPQVT